MAFTFKQFHIDDLHCGMPVSTDGVILGAWAPLTAAKRILDIGAGSGLLSLMAAQRSAAQITCVELDEKAAQACHYNLAQSPWPARFELVQMDIRDMCTQALYQAQFDHIICNPPYFEHGPKAQNAQRAMARHTDSLSFAHLLEAIHLCLAPKGLASLILPVPSLTRFMDCLESSSLNLVEQVLIKSVASKAANRVLLLLSASKRGSYQHSEFTILGSDGRYTQQMVELTKDFYLKL